MARDLERSLKTGKQEWLAFIEGRAISTSLLIQLLSHKYRRQKSVTVSPQAIIVEEGKRLRLPERLTTRSLTEYELSVVLFRKGEGSPTQALLIRRRVFPFHIFVTKELRQEDTEELEYASLNEERVTTLIGNNGYFMFDFIDEYFTGQLHPVINIDTKEQAALIVQELEKPSLVRQALNTLYRELNSLLAEVANLATNETHRRVETKKQHFFQQVEDALNLASKTIPPMTTEATSFLQLALPDEEDEVGEDEASHSDALFKELQQLLQFVLLVVKTAPQIDSLYIEVVEGVRLGPAEVTHRIRRITNRILSHVDELNVPYIDVLMEKSLGFGQRDYERLAGDEQFITYAIMSHTLSATLHPKIMLIGPQQGGEVTPIKSQPLILGVSY